MGPGHTFNFKRRTRGITRASRQLRSETLDLFLSLTPFRLELQGTWQKNDHDILVRKLTSLGPTLISQIHSIAILIPSGDRPCIGNFLGQQSGFPAFCVASYHSSIKLWRTLVPGLKKLGVQASQLSFPELEDAYIGRGPAWVARLAVLYNGIIKPALEGEGLLSATFPDVRDKMGTKFGALVVAEFDRVMAREAPKIREAFERVDKGVTQNMFELALSRGLSTKASLHGWSL